MGVEQAVELGKGNVNYTVVLIGAMFVFMVVKELFKVIKAKKNEDSGLPTWKELNDGFVRRGSCKDFKTRIGIESDDHREKISSIKNDITEIKEGVAYLKGRAS